MKPKILPLDRKLYDYLLAHRTPDDPVLGELREETARLGDRARMQIAPEQGTFLRMLVASSERPMGVVALDGETRAAEN